MGHPPFQLCKQIFAIRRDGTIIKDKIVMAKSRPEQAGTENQKPGNKKAGSP
jgi:hypothetical protein